MAILVTGRAGQVATALAEKAAAAGIELITLARPELDLTGEPQAITDAVVAAGYNASVIVNAAAYTAVDNAENEPDLAMAANGVGAGAVANAARRLGVPVIQISTDYVFDGAKNGPWIETDPVAPLGVYGASKLNGERAVASAHPRHVILRTAWIYSPFGHNFVRTMLRLGTERDRLKIVADQHGCPTSALDIADAVLTIADRLVVEPANGDLYGVFHLAGAGTANWADFARAIFKGAAARGRPVADVVSILTRDYPTPAARPKNSVLSTRRLEERYGLRLPEWEESLCVVLDRLLSTDDRLV